MKYVYPVILHQEHDGRYGVYVPAFECGTSGDDLANALEMAYDLIGTCGMENIYNNQPFPKADMNVPQLVENQFTSLVSIDFEQYRKKVENRSVRTSITLPSWLYEKAKESGINLSGAAQEGIKRELGLL